MPSCSFSSLNPSSVGQKIVSASYGCDRSTILLAARSIVAAWLDDGDDPNLTACSSPTALDDIAKHREQRDDTKLFSPGILSFSSDLLTVEPESRDALRCHFM